MNYLLRSAAYILHPLLMPLLGTLLYFMITPRYLERELVIAKLAAILIITVLIPLISFFLLKNLQLVSTLHLENVKERKVPLMIQCVLLLLIVKMVFDPFESAEMYYFFVGILLSAISALMLVFLNFKISLHQMAVAGVTMFLISLSVHFKINLLLWIGFFLFCNGWIATSRLHTKAHTPVELIAGFFIGGIPQLILIPYWL